MTSMEDDHKVVTPNPRSAVFRISFGGLLLACGMALALPWGMSWVHPIAGVISGVLVPLLWVKVMPVTCMNGAFIAFMLAILQIASGLSWAIRVFRMEF